MLRKQQQLANLPQDTSVNLSAIFFFFFCLLFTVFDSSIQASLYKFLTFRFNMAAINATT